MAEKGQRGFQHRQERYQVRIACQGHAPQLSEVVTSAATRHVGGGRETPAHALCAVSVRVWGAANSCPSPWSTEHTFATLPPQGRLNASWISERGAQEDTATTLLRKSFTTHAGQAPTTAVVSLSGLGHYVLTINGERIGDHQMDPGWTKYTTNGTCLFATHDVTKAIVAGGNALGVMLGNGMYNNVHSSRYAKWSGSAGVRTLSLQLSIGYLDGTTQVVTSDASWQGSAGPITFNGVYGGEDYNATQATELAGWDVLPFPPDPAGVWQRTSLWSGPGCALGPQLQPPVKIREQMPVPSVTSLGSSSYKYDFHQEFSGWPVLSVAGDAGTTVRMTPTELLDPSGRPQQVFGPAYWSYTLAGTGEVEVYRPSFFTYGFRYLQVDVLAPRGGGGSYRFIQATGDSNVYFQLAAARTKHHVGMCTMCGVDICGMLLRETPAYVAALKTGGNFTCDMIPDQGNATISSIAGEFVYSSAPIVANFTCSNPMYNRIHAMILAAMKSNLVGIFTDCPHRERLGWLEQSWLLAKSMGHNFDMSTLYPKIVRDMAEAQTAAGMVPDIAPEYVIFNGGFRDSPEWGIAFPMVAIYLADEYGDKATLEQHWPALVRYMGYLASRVNAKGIIAYGLGDWESSGDHSPIGVTATMVYLEGLQNMARVALELGKTDDRKRFQAQAQAVAKSYNAVFGGAGPSFAKGSQTATAMPCTLGVAPALNSSLAWLRGSLLKANNHSLCGEIGWPYVVRAFAASAGGAGVLDSILERTDSPSYGYMLSVGATTLTESWSASRSASWNHAMNGHIDAWFFEHVGGVVSTAAGRPVVLAPRPRPAVTSAEVNRTLPTGPLQMRWAAGDQHGALQVELLVPPGANVHLRLPTRHPADITVNGAQLEAARDAAVRQGDWTDGDDTGITLGVAPGAHAIVVGLA